MKRKKLTEEHKQKISASSIGKNTWMKGRKLTKEHKLNISKGVKLNPPNNPKERKEGYVILDTRTGYNLIKINNKWISEHRYIFLRDNDLGYFFIPDGWIVHHKNEIKTDNRIENLAMIPKAIHTQIHKRGGIL